MAVLRIPFTPFEFRVASGAGWSSLEAAVVNNPDDDLARRETKIRAAFKSDHLTEIFGEEDVSDMFTAPDGKVYYGRFTPGLDGERHVISARQVYARQAHADARRAARNSAQLSAQQAVAAAQSSSNGAAVTPAAEPISA